MALPKGDDRFTKECVLFFEEALQVFGVPKSVGQIYGVLYCSPKPLSFSDIVERLDISKGSVSQGLQLLRSLGAIKVAGGREAVQEAGRQGAVTDPSRREYYEPELGLRRLLSGVLRERVEPLAATSAERMAHLRELAAQSKSDCEFYLDRVKQLETWRRRLRTALPLVEALLGPKRS